MTKISKIGVQRMQKVLHSLFAFARCVQSYIPSWQILFSELTARLHVSSLQWSIPKMRLSYDIAACWWIPCTQVLAMAFPRLDLAHVKTMCRESWYRSGPRFVPIYAVLMIRTMRFTRSPNHPHTYLLPEQRTMCKRNAFFHLDLIKFIRVIVTSRIAHQPRQKWKYVPQ